MRNERETDDSDHSHSVIMKHLAVYMMANVDKEAGEDAQLGLKMIDFSKILHDSDTGM